MFQRARCSKLGVKGKTGDHSRAEKVYRELLGELPEGVEATPAMQWGTQHEPNGRLLMQDVKALNSLTFTTSRTW